VKSCGSGAAVLALSPREAKLLGDNGGKRAVLREEHEVSRKAIAQGRPECSQLPCMLVCIFVCANRTRDRGCSKHPVFPAPSVFREGKIKTIARAFRAARTLGPYPRCLTVESEEPHCVHGRASRRRRLSGSKGNSLTMQSGQRRIPISWIWTAGAFHSNQSAA
jgi:hypothetical protein